MPKVPKLEDIPVRQRTPLVKLLLEAIACQQEEICRLEAEVQTLQDDISRLTDRLQNPVVQPSRSLPRTQTGSPKAAEELNSHRPMSSARSRRHRGSSKKSEE